MNCRHFGHALSLPFLDLRNAPPSNAYLDAAAMNAPETWYTLRVEEARAAKGLQAGLAGGLGGNVGTTEAADYSLGVSINLPLLSPGLAPATSSARKRAEAASAQRAEALESRRFRVAEMHEQTQASFDRLRRAGALLRDTDQLRNFMLQQWQQFGRRSLFDVMATKGEHYNLRVSYVNALHDGKQLNALLLSLQRGINEWLR